MTAIEEIKLCTVFAGMLPQSSPTCELFQKSLPAKLSAVPLPTSNCAISQNEGRMDKRPQKVIAFSDGTYMAEYACVTHQGWVRTPSGGEASFL